MSTASEPRCPRPARDERIQAYIDWGMTRETLASIGVSIDGSSVSRPRHASEDSNPRPMTKVDLAESAELEDQVFAPKRREIPDAGVFAIWASGRRVALDKGLVVPPSHLWWFATPYDTVLLSDRVTHHYTRVSAVDREAETIGFMDLWPDQFFLKEGRNTLGICARGTIISRADFARAAIGINTWDRLSLFEAYLAAFPEQATSAEVQCRIGYAIMTIGSERLTPRAAVYFDRARQLAKSAGNAPLEREAAARVYVSAGCGYAWSQATADTATVQRMRELLSAAQNHDPEVLLAQLRPRELGRLAYCMEKIGAYPTVEAVIKRAIELDPDFEDGYWLRGTARFKAGYPRDALEDFEKMFALIEKTLAQLDASERATHPHNSVALQQITAQRGERWQRRTLALEAAVNAAGAVPDINAALAYLRQLVALHPTRDEYRQRLETIERTLS